MNGMRVLSYIYIYEYYFIEISLWSQISTPSISDKIRSKLNFIFTAVIEVQYCIFLPQICRSHREQRKEFKIIFLIFYKIPRYCW
jgi:hypothetical protein